MSDESLCTFGRMLNINFNESHPKSIEEVKKIRCFPLALRQKSTCTCKDSSFDFKYASEEIINSFTNASSIQTMLPRFQQIVTALESLVDVRFYKSITYFFFTPLSLHPRISQTDILMNPNLI